MGLRDVLLRARMPAMRRILELAPVALATDGPVVINVAKLATSSDFATTRKRRTTRSVTEATVESDGASRPFSTVPTQLCERFSARRAARA